MNSQLSPAVAAYISATNEHNAEAFLASFTPDAVVQDAGRQFNGLAEIEAWSSKEVIGDRVTLDVVAVAERDGQTVVTTQVDGNFDKTGLPSPLFLDHHISVGGDKITLLTIRLAEPEART
jgi:hypothetical protein